MALLLVVSHRERLLRDKNSRAVSPPTYAELAPQTMITAPHTTSKTKTRGIPLDSPLRHHAGVSDVRLVKPSAVSQAPGGNPWGCLMRPKQIQKTLPALAERNNQRRRPPSLTLPQHVRRYPVQRDPSTFNRRFSTLTYARSRRVRTNSEERLRVLLGSVGDDHSCTPDSSPPYPGDLVL